MELNITSRMAHVLFFYSLTLTFIFMVKTLVFDEYLANITITIK